MCLKSKILQINKWLSFLNLINNLYELYVKCDFKAIIRQLKWTLFTLPTFYNSQSNYNRILFRILRFQFNKDASPITHIPLSTRRVSKCRLKLQNCTFVRGDKDRDNLWSPVGRNNAIGKRKLSRKTNVSNGSDYKTDGCLVVICVVVEHSSTVKSGEFIDFSSAPSKLGAVIDWGRSIDVCVADVCVSELLHIPAPTWRCSSLVWVSVCAFARLFTRRMRNLFGNLGNLFA